MKDLTIVKVNNKLTTDSRDIALMVEKEHKILLRDIRNYINQMEEANKNMSTDLYPSDYFIENTYLDDYKREKPCYAITKIGCDFIANKMTGIKGTAFTGIYTKRFDEMEKVLKEQQPKLPTTYKEALQQLLIEVEEKEQLQLENQEKDKVIQLQQPKVLFADSVASSDNSILVGELAKLLRQNGIDTGQNRLFDWLRNNGYLIKRKGEDYNAPTQKSVDLGVIETKEGPRVHPDGHTSITKTPKITGKGQIYFINKFKKNNQISMLG
ncbi:TPA: phage antirepressor KilAC domain-containing protein [Clostridioides difficile]|uniref:phage antirepressor KilAC domain-containing protein n=1 Tax=Clostridioides difficile TaxID=1496 RepID=UPI000938FF7E|nr:phage antirepressor KilAC domain-containing protein [Clostridioides difficile]MBY2870716.1 phage antirepressor KilAC domain-containing protein [Clostridioides difficile]VHX56662.1 phage anti-repressor [Clostridioides difficile]HBF0770618.1 phage antirepressor KilAC domain-containing protein [Clostridioides difficile]HBF2285642.1 phage antirepressor KilAC domain-containing protein [Clostridioides difficile]HBF3734856.1 phage antirepressor KilAC domain-containing protein [Clostridioides diffi